MVVVESSEELEEMIENDVMEELERRVRNRINEVQGVWRIADPPASMRGYDLGPLHQ